MGDGAPRGRSRPARTRGWLAVVLAALAGHLLLADTVASDGLYFLVVVGAAVASWTLVGTGAGRTSGVLLALGLTASAGADVVWQVLVWRGVDVDLSVADLLYLASYVFVAAALTRMAAAGQPARARVDGWIDAVIVFVAVLLVMGELTLADTLGDTSQPWLVRVVWALYPALDAALIALVFRVVSGAGRYERRALAVAAGAACWLVSDIGYLLAADPAAAPVVLESGWMLGAVLLAVASHRRLDRPAAPERPESGGFTRLAVSLGALLVPATIELVHDLTDAAKTPLSMFGATLILVVLVFLRTARLLQAESAARALVRSQARYSAALAAHSSDAVIVVDRAGRLQSDSAPLAALLRADSAPDLVVSGLIAGAGLDVTESRVVFQRALEAAGAVVSAELARRVGEEERWLGVRLVDLSDDPDVQGVVIHATDITERKRAEQTLAHQAFHDGLTGLANRALFTDRVEQALRHNARHGDAAAVVYIDLDGFKAVNDSLGHQAGDVLLQKVAERLSATVRGGDTLARLGGDEFAILVEQTTGPAEASATGERVLAALEGPIRIGRQSVSVSGSIGIAVSDGDATSDSMIRDADNAMYAAKAAGRGRVVVFDPAMRAAVVEQRELERQLQGALADGQVRLVYQPVVDLSDESVVGFEALLRWHSPTLGSIPPDRFVPLAEALGLIGDIGAWVLREACVAAATWRRDDPPAHDLTMAVNVSAVQLASHDLVGQITEALTSSGLPASALVLEVTETALVRDPDAAAEQLAALRALGVRLALDDFGTGYSSLSYLRQFTVDILKIDRSFISTIQGAGLPPIVRGLIDLGRTLDLEIVAEGVELEVQRDQLRAGRCELAQGYLFAAPLERSDVDRFLDERSRMILAGSSDGPAR